MRVRREREGERERSREEGQYIDEQLKAMNGEKRASRFLLKTAVFLDNGHYGLASFYHYAYLSIRAI